MNRIIESFFEPKDIAVVGISHTRESMGNAIVKTLHQNGFKIYPIHPDGGEVEKIRCLKSLKELPAGVQSLVVCLSPKSASEIVDSAKDSGIKKIWFMQGANFKAEVEKAKEAGMEVVSRKCVLMYAPPVTSIHAFHRFFVKLVGRL